MEDDGQLASFRLLISPLVIWLWIGGASLMLGGVLAWWPRPASQVAESQTPALEGEEA